MEGDKNIYFLYIDRPTELKRSKKQGGLFLYKPTERKVIQVAKQVWEESWLYYWDSVSEKINSEESD